MVARILADKFVKFENIGSNLAKRERMLAGLKSTNSEDGLTLVYVVFTPSLSGNALFTSEPLLPESLALLVKVDHLY